MAAAFVQGISNYRGTGLQTTLTATFGSNVTVGNTIVLSTFCYDRSNGFATFSVADNLGNTYTLVDQVDENTNDESGATFVAPVTVGGACTITVTYSSPTGREYQIILAHEVSGVSGVDKHTGQADNATTAANNDTSGSVTTDANGCYIFGAATGDASFTSITAGSGFTSRESVSDSGVGIAALSEDQIQATAGAIATTFTIGTAQICLTFIVALKPATTTLPVNTVAPAISGTNQVGSVLTCSTGTWSPTPSSYSYRWQRSTSSSGPWTDISGATSSTYTLQGADSGNYIRCGVTGNP